MSFPSLSHIRNQSIPPTGRGTPTTPSGRDTPSTPNSLSVPSFFQSVERITPEEQFKRVYTPVQIDRNRTPAFPESLEQLIMEYALGFIGSNWKVALQRIEALPAYIPALPEDIHTILGSRCPGLKKQPKRNYYPSIAENCVLLLIPEENLKELVNRVGAYFLTNHPDERWNAPLLGSSLTPVTRDEAEALPLGPLHWVLMTKEIVPGSQNLSDEDLSILMKRISKKCGAQYKISLVTDAIAATLLHQVATNEILFEEGGHIRVLHDGDMDLRFGRLPLTKGVGASFRLYAAGERKQQSGAVATRTFPEERNETPKSMSARLKSTFSFSLPSRKPSRNN